MSNAKLRETYRAWWSKLSADERARLTETGFDHTNPGITGVPRPFRYIESGKDTSADGNDYRDFVNYADWSMRGYDIDHQIAHMWQSAMMAEESIMDDRTFTREEMLDIISKAMSVFTDSVHPAVRLHGTCIKIALGVPGQPNMTELSKTVGVTRAEVSRRVKNIQKKMGLPPSVYMKSEHACQRLKRK